MIPSLSILIGLQFSYPVKAKNRAPREHDWIAIREKLRAELVSFDIRSLADIAKDLDIDDRHLYIPVTDEARMIGGRYVQHLHQVARQNEKELQAELKQAAKSAREQGGVASVASVTELLGQLKVNSVRGLYASLARINSELDAANDDM